MGHRKGINLVAYLPVSKTTVLDIGTQPDQGGGLFHTLRKKSFIFTQGYFDDQKDPFNVDFSVYGTGFKYKSLFPGTPQVPIDGKIKEVSVSVAGQLGLEISGLHLSVPKAEKLWKKDDPMAAFAALLTGDDTIIGSNDDDPNLWGGKGNDLLWGRGGNDIINGFRGDDINDGGPGNDYLKDTRGANTFQFSTPFMTGEANRDNNFDTIKKLKPVDRVYLNYNYFDAAEMKVSKGELAFTEQAQDKNDYFLFHNRTFYYDPDGNGSTPATPIFQTENDAKLTHKMIAIGYAGYEGP